MSPTATIVRALRRLGPLLVALGCATALSARAADGDAYPSKPVHLVVPFAVGGGSDILARLIADKLAPAWGQPVVVDNVPGANGVVANELVSRRPGDGLTLLFGSSSTQVVADLTAKPPRDPLHAFAPVGIVAYTPLVLVVNARSPVTTLAQYLALAHTRPMTFATFGQGSSPHILGEILAGETGANLVHVPYRGSGPAVTDLLGEHVDSAILTVAAVRGQVASGHLRALAISGASRSAALPAVPTFAELGQRQLTESGWFAVFAPASTPAAIREQVSARLHDIVALPDVRARMLELGLDPAGSTPAQAQAALAHTVDVVGDVIRRAHIVLEP